MQNSTQIKIASTPEEISRCYAVMKQLRPQYSEEQFVAQVIRQQKEAGFVLAYIEDTPFNPPQPEAAASDQGERGEIRAAMREIRAVAGFRIDEHLAWGKALYVDDLVSDEATRGKGFAFQLFDWLVNYAKEQNCDQFHLDSGAGPNRYRAHRFYLIKGMNITSHHFAMMLK